MNKNTTQGDFMPKGYHHLTHIQRCQICTLKDRGDSFRSIANHLKVHPSTISREIKRNSGLKGYRHTGAHQKARLRKNTMPNNKMGAEVIAALREKLKLGWSPVQISGHLKRHGNQSVSHETIYKFIWKDKRSGGDLFRLLRRKGKKYNKRAKQNAGRGMIPNRVDISLRPDIVEDKTRLGDWEIDTIIGARHKGAIVSMVERSSKLTKLVRVPRKTADLVAKALCKRLKPIEAFVHTLTADNGKEFAFHEAVSTELGAGFYFATPYHSWERGLNEHTNGLVREYFPKSTNFLEITEKQVLEVEKLLNNRPRKVLGFETPLERFERVSENMLKWEVH